VQVEQREETLREREVQRVRREQLQQQQEQQQQQQQAAEQRQQRQEAKRRKKDAKAQEEKAIRALRKKEERSVFWAWADELGYDNWDRFVDASVVDILQLKMSSEELTVVLHGLANDDPAAWVKFKSSEGQKFMRLLVKILDDGSSSAAHDRVAGGGVIDSADDSCVICMAEPKSVSLVHPNETSHRCVCVECSDRLKATGAACPVCRLPIICHLKNQFES
jgi:hypothetical protein